MPNSTVGAVGEFYFLSVRPAKQHKNRRRLTICVSCLMNVLQNSVYLLRRFEIEGNGVDAVAQPRGGRTVAEYVSQVGVAAGAKHLGSGHPKGVVLPGPDACGR